MAYDVKGNNNKLGTIVRALTITILLTTLALTGCATNELMNKAEGFEDIHFKLEVLKINSAYKDESNEAVHVCMQVLDLQTHIESEMTLSIPIQNKDRWIIHSLSNDIIPNQGISEKVSDTYVQFRPASQDLTKQCMPHGSLVPILKATEDFEPENTGTRQEVTSFNLPGNIPEAVYTFNRKGFPINFGYISSQSLINDAHTIDVSASQLNEVRIQGKPKRYLYMLMPVTVVVDATVMVLMLYAEGTQYNNRYHYATPKSGSK